jgi:hypothetical protein
VTVVGPDVGAVVVAALVAGVVPPTPAVVARGAVVAGGAVVLGGVVVGPDVVEARVVGADVGAAEVVVDWAAPPSEPQAAALKSAASAAAEATAS